MKQRVITGVIAVVVLLAVLALSGTFVYPTAVILLSLIGTFEMLRCVGGVANPFYTVPSLVYALTCPLLAVFYRYGAIVAVTFAYLCVLFLFTVFFSDKVKVTKACVVFSTVLYIVVCFTCLLRLRYVTTDGGERIGHFVYLLVLVGAWVTDTFAYFTGFFVGKHKLCPTISPKKTVEGAVGGMLFCMAAFVLYGVILALLYPTITPNYLGLAVIGLVMSALAQCGDLLMSVIKRAYGVKDFGTLFPGHGGVLDRFDSVLLLSPFLLYLCEDGHFFRFFFHFKI